MLVLLSPTKTMKKMDYKGKSSVPFFENQATMIANQFQTFDVRQLQKWYNVSDNIAQQAYIHWQTFDTQSKTIALFAYQGEAFRNLDAASLTKAQIEKVGKHLRILSALYGVIRPLDEIVSYRLDLTKNFPGLGSGIAYWREHVTNHLLEEIEMHKQPFIINCSSNEYTDMIDIQRIKKSVLWVQVNFEYIKDNKNVAMSMHAKAARGTLARELCLKPVTSIGQMDRYLIDYGCKIDKKNGIVTYIKQL
ncbi:MAG: hypothetical protein CVU94_07735 [Firmicutes bacterium HGW-Firmicutes-19]|nr:MAG: hypothetical protein CVU94_07735 [Firmicutes bacterium HGW-Firmicutes-19]